MEFKSPLEDAIERVVERVQADALKRVDTVKIYTGEYPTVHACARCDSYMSADNDHLCIVCRDKEGEAEAQRKWHKELLRKAGIRSEVWG